MDVVQIAGVIGRVGEQDVALAGWRRAVQALHVLGDCFLHCGIGGAAYRVDDCVAVGAGVDKWKVGPQTSVCESVVVAAYRVIRGEEGECFACGLVVVYFCVLSVAVMFVEFDCSGDRGEGSKSIEVCCPA